MISIKPITTAFNDRIRPLWPIEIHRPLGITVVLVLSSLLSFIITWMLIQQSAGSDGDINSVATPRMFSGTIANSTLQDQSLSEEKSGSVPDHPDPLRLQSNIEIESAANHPEHGWSPDHFLDVLKKPTATPIHVSSKKKPVDSPKTHPGSTQSDATVEKSVQLTTQSDANESTRQSADQAAFEITPALRKIKPRPLRFNPDGSIIVQEGDSLARIASILYRDARKSRRIYELNKDVIPNPRSLKVGTRLEIPETQY